VRALAALITVFLMANASISYRQNVAVKKPAHFSGWSESYSGKKTTAETESAFRFIKNIERYFAGKNLYGGYANGQYKIMYRKEN
jgi:hypothetical protein